MSTNTGQMKTNDCIVYLHNVSYAHTHTHIIARLNSCLKSRMAQCQKGLHNSIKITHAVCCNCLEPPNFRTMQLFCLCCPAFFKNQICKSNIRQAPGKVSFFFIRLEALIWANSRSCANFTHVKIYHRSWYFKCSPAYKRYFLLSTHFLAATCYSQPLTLEQLTTTYLVHMLSACWAPIS